MYHALSKRHGYPRAPINALTLQEAPSAFVYQKILDSVQKRPHVRFWPYPGRANLWLGAAAEDVEFRFALTHWTHSTIPTSTGNGPWWMIWPLPGAWTLPGCCREPPRTSCQIPKRGTPHRDGRRRGGAPVKRLSVSPPDGRREGKPPPGGHTGEWLAP
jgi:hypothetical protein